MTGLQQIVSDALGQWGHVTSNQCFEDCQCTGNAIWSYDYHIYTHPEHISVCENETGQTTQVKLENPDALNHLLDATAAYESWHTKVSRMLRLLIRYLTRT